MLDYSDELCDAMTTAEIQGCLDKARRAERKSRARLDGSGDWWLLSAEGRAQLTLWEAQDVAVTWWERQLARRLAEVRQLRMPAYTH